MSADALGFDVTQLEEISPIPKTIISKNNLSRFRHLVDRDISTLISKDYLKLEVGKPTSFDTHPAFFAATIETPDAELDENNRGMLKNFTRGLPFSKEPSTEDSLSGIKIAWNMRYAYFGDSGRVPEMIWELKDWRKKTIDFRMSFSGSAMRFTHRHILQPTPAIPKNPENAFGAAYLTAIDAGSYDKTEALIYINKNEAEDINGWVYIPQLERTQSLASFRTEESMFGSDILATDFLTFSGRIVDFDWIFLGTTYTLLPLYRHDLAQKSEKFVKKHNYRHVAFSGRADCFPKVPWQIRKTYVLKAVSKKKSSRVGTRIFFIDAQTMAPVIWKIYDKNNRLWKLIINAFAHANSHALVNQESGAPVLTGFSTIDTLTNRCTTIQLLTIINDKTVKFKDFTVNNMRVGGRRFR